MEAGKARTCVAAGCRDGSPVQKDHSGVRERAVHCGAGIEERVAAWLMVPVWNQEGIQVSISLRSSSCSAQSQTQLACLRGGPSAQRQCADVARDI